MSEEEVLFKNRIRDLAERSYSESRYTFTNFLTLAEQSLFHEMERELGFAGTKVFGGHESCERVVIRFGKEEELGYIEDFPISILKIEPLIGKFSDELSHRDYLGALMNLGIEREVLGDIFPADKSAVLFCLDSMADYIIENVSRIRHTSVRVTKLEECPKIKAIEGEIKNIQIASERVDAVLAKAYNLSRSECIEYFRDRKVFINGSLCESNSKLLKPGDRITLRGFGKTDYLGSKGTTKKGKISSDIKIY